MESCECSYMSQENPVYPVNPVLSLYASGDAPASEVSNRRSGKGCIPTRERSTLYTSPTKQETSSFRQGLPESRSHGGQLVV